MVKVEIHVKTNVEAFKPKMKEIKQRGLRYTSNYMIDRLQVHSPIDTGHLKGWFRYRQHEDLIDIRSPAQYAIFQDQGTYSYGPSGRKPKTKDVGGIRPKRFVEKSTTETSARIQEFFIKAIQETL